MKYYQDFSKKDDHFLFGNKSVNNGTGSITADDIAMESIVFVSNDIHS